MLHLIACPDAACAAPAEVLDWTTLRSTDGAVRHVKTFCVQRHIFFMPADRVLAGGMPADRLWSTDHEPAWTDS